MKSFVTAVLVVLVTAPAVLASSQGKSGFERFCSGCHPDGGNPVNPSKTLRKIDREANGIKTSADIVRVMRKPGQGMRTYTREDISDAQARQIAEYILATFQ